MAGEDHVGRIPRHAFMIASITLFAISVLAAVARIAIRLRYRKRLFADDAFLFLAVVCLCISMALLCVFGPLIFVIEELITVRLSPELPPDFVSRSVGYQKLAYIYISLVWMTIFAVKFSFLFFFKNLVRCIRPMTIYWWIITVGTGVIWAFGIAQPFISCPYFDLRSSQCWAGPGLPRALGVLATTVALDITTDILIIVIPVRLLWHVQIKPRQKLVIGVSFCLSIMMIVTALTRLCGIRASTGAMDITWDSFWHLSEGCIAVTMVSSTAFRTFFVAHRSHTQRNPDRVPFWRRQKPWKREAFGIESEGNGAKDRMALPEVPPAALVGLRTLMRSDRTESKGTFLRSETVEEEENSWPLPGTAAAQRFGKHCHVSLETETVRSRHFSNLEPTYRYG